MIKFDTQLFHWGRICVNSYRYYLAQPSENKVPYWLRLFCFNLITWQACDKRWNSGHRYAFIAMVAISKISQVTVLYESADRSVTVSKKITETKIFGS